LFFPSVFINLGMAIAEASCKMWSKLPQGTQWILHSVYGSYTI